MQPKSKFKSIHASTHGLPVGIPIPIPIPILASLGATQEYEHEQRSALHLAVLTLEFPSSCLLSLELVLYLSPSSNAQKTFSMPEVTPRSKVVPRQVVPSLRPMTVLVVPSDAALVTANRSVAGESGPTMRHNNNAQEAAVGKLTLC